MSTNVVRDSTAADMLNNVRTQQSSDLVGNTGQSIFIPQYIVPESDTVNVTDSVSVNGDLQSLSDIIDITDSVTNTTQNSGTFVIDTAEIDFSDLS